MTNMPHFTETEPYEKGFAAVFDEQVAPKLQDLEAERLALHKAWQKRLMITIGGTLFFFFVAAILTFITWGRFEDSLAAARLCGSPEVVLAQRLDMRSKHMSAADRRHAAKVLRMLLEHSFALADGGDDELIEHLVIV